MKNLLIVGCGGFIGATLRYSMALLATTLSWQGWAPTLAVNLIGSLVIGFLAPFFNASNVEWRLFIIVGILGGFTTFSSFSLDALTLYNTKGIFSAILYAGITVMGCLFAVWCGWKGHSLIY